MKTIAPNPELTPSEVQALLDDTMTRSNPSLNLRRAVSKLKVSLEQLKAEQTERRQEYRANRLRPSARTIQDMLALVGLYVSVPTIIAWTQRQRDQAERWAARTHLRASDNNVSVPPKPRFLP